MNLKITNIEDYLMDIIIAFCNLHYINYQRITTGNYRRAPGIVVHIDNEELIMLLTKILNECDKYDFGTIQIM